MHTVPAIDLFAGPGGLNEGFSRFDGPGVRYDVRLSIEKDNVACQTLRLRSFYRQFASEDVPPAFYAYIKGNKSKFAEIEGLPEWRSAGDHVRQWTLGAAPGNDGHVAPLELHTTIEHALTGAGTRWLLLGGPPCQAYSLIGRARMTGLGAKVKGDPDLDKVERSRRKREEEFQDDHRHTLYREYLRVVAVHQPAAFVMENVKGILSAKIPLQRDDGTTFQAQVFDQIQRDLSNPWSALSSDPDVETLRKFAEHFGRGERRYRLYSFVRTIEDAELGLDGSDFVIRAEKFGVPQMRHRVIILGIRDDILTRYSPLVVNDELVTVRQMLADMPPLRSRLSKEKTTVESYGEDSDASWYSAVVGETTKALKDSTDASLLRAVANALSRAHKLKQYGGGYLEIADTLAHVPKELRAFMHDRHLGGVIQHEARSHMASDLARYLYLAVSTNRGRASDQATPTLESWPESLLPKHANVRQENRSRVVDGFVDRFRVQAWDRPSSTVTSHIQKDGHYFIHPDARQCRSLTVREAARLQTFPENYYFEGNRTEQFLQVGNAVPPYLALQLAAIVASVFI